jgi:hypothetical protein
VSRRPRFFEILKNVFGPCCTKVCWYMDIFES